MPEAILMWSAAVILAAVATAATVFALWFVASAVMEFTNRYRVRGLSRAQIGQVRQLAAELRRSNGTVNGTRTPPVDPVNQPRRHPDDEETDNV